MQVEHVVYFDKGLRRFRPVMADQVMSPRGERSEVQVASKKASACDSEGEERDLLAVPVERRVTSFDEGGRTEVEDLRGRCACVEGGESGQRRTVVSIREEICC
ncbi:hypothetical protein C5C39_09785 [Rathayibacter sp. AY1F3]|nr:hypothetical protein C5C39_09785 [Rathayibacter sp. AY1F3]